MLKKKTQEQQEELSISTAKHEESVAGTMKENAQLRDEVDALHEKLKT